MRLLHAETLEFHSFLESELPRYLILSHTWGNEEVSYQEMCLVQRFKTLPDHLKDNPLLPVLLSLGSNSTIFRGEDEIINRKGYDKIVQTAKITRKRGFEYFWIDTCCIDKSSSAELQESINSMYRWYKISAYCVVHFEDAKPIEEQDVTIRRELDNFKHCLQNSRWNTRGWTLQELIAPPSLGFYDQTWKHIVEKRWALEQLSKVTQIPEYVLVTGDLTDTSVAQKMSWAAKRSTSRVEDMAYSLLGLFGIHMPMLYGEGENAFLRLQEEIMKTTTDDSIFAWYSLEDDDSIYRGLLARSPIEFAFSGGILRGNNNYTITSTNIGVEVGLWLTPLSGNNKFLARLSAHDDVSHIEITLRDTGTDPARYTRLARKFTYTRFDEARGEHTTIHVRQSPSVCSSFMAPEMHCFYFRRSRSPNASSVYISNAWPPQNWHGPKELLISPGKENFVGVVLLQLLYPVMPARFYLLMGLDRENLRYWCKIVHESAGPWPEFDAPAELWRKKIVAQGPFDDCKSFVWLVIEKLGFQCKIEMRAGMRRDRISLMVDITGLM